MMMKQVIEQLPVVVVVVVVVGVGVEISFIKQNEKQKFIIQ